ncbi:hypothetical protein CMK11_07530 [Candidatus Poribacteria bacterium]|nr:hypothetical protein [Candidatus Poribacteria bacterium]
MPTTRRLMWGATLVGVLLYIATAPSVLARAPRHARIVFASDRDGVGVAEIYTMDPDGGGVRRLTQSGGMAGHPRWSPNGRSIAFAWEPPDGTFDVYVMDPDGRNIRNLTGSEISYDAQPSWSPDGREIAYASQGFAGAHIRRADLDGGSSAQVTFTEPIDAAFDSAPSWSPDGSEIAFVTTRGSLSEIFAVDPGGGQARQITRDDAWSRMPRWSPDARRLVYARGLDGETPGLDLYSAAADGEGIRRLTEHADSDAGPAWSPDGANIVFSRRRGIGFGSTSDILVMTFGGGEVRDLTAHPSTNTGPDWFDPTMLRVGAAGRRPVLWSGLRALGAPR